MTSAKSAAVPLRAMAIDIDGTLINSSKDIMPFTRSEISRVMETTGAKLFIVTARGLKSSKVIEKRLGVNASHATLGGSVVHARDGDTLIPLRQQPLPSKEVSIVLGLAGGLPVHVGIYTLEGWHVSDLGYWGLREARNTAVWPDSVLVVGEMHVGSEEIYKVMFRGEQDVLVSIKEKVDEVCEGLFAHQSGKVLEITSSDARKFSAVDLLCSHFGFSPENVIAFGDTESDAEMLEKVGVGVIMDNAAAYLKLNGKFERTLSNDEDGVGISLRKYFPTGAGFLA